MDRGRHPGRDAARAPGHRASRAPETRGALGRCAFRAALAALALAVSTSSHAEVINRILATVDGDPITLYEFNQFAERDVRGRQLAAASDRATVLDMLITERMIDKEFATLGLSVPDAEIERYINGIKERNRLTDQQLRDALAEQGLTWEEYHNQIRRELQKVQLINQQVRGKVSVTPEEVERYYQAHRDEYSIAEQFSVSHIVLLLPADAPPDQVDAVSKRAVKIHAELEGGASFEEVAQRESEDAAAKSGGKLGTFKKGEMLEPLEAQALRLKVGAYSEPFRSPVGVHILRLDERSGTSYESLENLAQDIRERLYSEALEERFDRWLREDLRQRHHVELRP